MTAKKKAVQSREDLDRLILSNLRTGIVPEPTAAAIDDLRYFEKRAAEGAPIKFDALANYMQEKHGLRLGQSGMHTLCTRQGIKPWWAKK
jgi:hypothetical protein